MTDQSDHPFLRVPDGCSLNEAQRAQRLRAIEHQKILGTLKGAETPKALRDVAETLVAINLSGLAESLRFAAARIETARRDHLGSRAIVNVESALAEFISAATSSFEGGVVPPPPKKSDYDRSMQRYQDEYDTYQRRKEAAMSAIDAMAYRNGMR